jgi:hypothetical protein
MYNKMCSGEDDDNNYDDKYDEKELKEHDDKEI